MTGFDVAGFAALPDAARADLWERLNPAQRAAVHAGLVEQVAAQDPLEGCGWEEWNRLVVPAVTSSPDAPHHIDFWEWTDGIRPGVRPKPFMAFWPRGHSKSTKAEVFVVKLGVRGVRTYFLYVSATQDQADDHVRNIGLMLESPEIREHYPAHARPQVQLHGQQSAWRRNRLWTEGGMIVDAIGLDTAARGKKLGSDRPDAMVLDDIDDPHASTAVVQKNIRSITNGLIPALQPHAAIVVAQNVVAAGSIASRLIDGRTVFLADAIRSGPLPAVADTDPGPDDPEDSDWFQRDDDGRFRIVRGTPTWPARMDLRECEDQLTAMGPEAFITECQQDTGSRPGAVWRRGDISYWRGELPEFDLVIVAVDPNKTGRGDDAGVVVLGRHRPPLVGDDGLPVVSKVSGRPKTGPPVVVVLDDLTGTFTPSLWRDMAVKAGIRWAASTIVVERTGLGEHATLTLKGSPEFPGSGLSVRPVDADLGKKDRARPVWRLYVEQPSPRVFHRDRFPALDTQLTSWEPDHDKMSPGALDALVHGVTFLLIGAKGAPNVATADAA